MIPVAYGLLGPDGGRPAPRACSSSPKPTQSFAWDLPARPVPSLLRGFSAPVILERETTPGRARLPARPRRRPVQQLGGRARLRAGAPDPAGRRPRARPSTPTISPRWRRSPTTAPRPGVQGPGARPAAEEEIIAHVAGAGGVPDPLAVYRARRALEAAVGARRSATGSSALYADNAVAGPYSPGRRRRRPPGAARPGAGAPDRARPGGARGARRSSTPPTT